MQLKKEIENDLIRNWSVIFCRVFSKNLTNLISYSHLYLRQNNIEQFIISIVLQIGSFTWNIWYYGGVHDSKKICKYPYLYSLAFLGLHYCSLYRHTVRFLRNSIHIIQCNQRKY